MKDIFITLLAIILLVYIFSYGVDYRNVTFNSDNTELENQYSGHYGFGHFGLHELYPHMFAGILLFVASILSSNILYKRFGRSRFTWRPVIAGIFVTGLIGLGETLEHLYSTLWHEFFHYLHMIGGILAMYFLYVGTQEYRMQYKQGGKPISPQVILGMIVILPLLSMVIALNAKEAWDRQLELPFIYLTALPTLFLASMTIWESYRQKEAYRVLMGFLGFLAGTVTGLTAIILLGRIGDIMDNAFIYILGQSLQVIYLSATAMLILVFTFTMWAMCDTG